MSIEDLSAFFAKLEADPAMQEQARALAGAPADERVAGLCRLAADQGFAVAPEDWEHQDAAVAVAALDDEALKQVAGGNTQCNVLGALIGSHETASPLS